MTQHPYQGCFRVRTVTCFVTFEHGDFANAGAVVADKVAAAADFLQLAERILTAAGYTVQTVRMATNPFGEWLLYDTEDNATTAPTDVAVVVHAARLELLDRLLAKHQIQFCALGPAMNVQQVRDGCVPILMTASRRFYCSAALRQNDVNMARQCAETILEISKFEDGLGNFRFCVAAAAVDGIPFFPVAKACPKSGQCSNQFAIGLENGVLAHKLLSDCGSIRNVSTAFSNGMSEALTPLQLLCQDKLGIGDFEFLGIDTSLNPSLDEGGSVAAAIETLDEVESFGGPGTLAAAATITETLQSLPGIQHCGYSGLMLPVCEDQRLAELTDNSALGMANLLSISQVCGVGVDTVPIPGDCTAKQLASLLLDVAGIAYRWNKSLSCRVLPVAGKRAGDWTTFDSPYMRNTRIMPLSPSSLHVDHD